MNKHFTLILFYIFSLNAFSQPDTISNLNTQTSKNFNYSFGLSNYLIDYSTPKSGEGWLPSSELKSDLEITFHKRFYPHLFFELGFGGDPKFISSGLHDGLFYSLGLNYLSPNILNIFKENDSQLNLEFSLMNFHRLNPNYKHYSWAYSEYEIAMNVLSPLMGLHFSPNKKISAFVRAGFCLGYFKLKYKYPEIGNPIPSIAGEPYKDVAIGINSELGIEYCFK